MEESPTNKGVLSTSKGGQASQMGWCGTHPFQMPRNRWWCRKFPTGAKKNIPNRNGYRPAHTGDVK